MARKHKPKVHIKTGSKSSKPKKGFRFKKLIISIAISLVVLLIGLHFISQSYLGVPLTTLAKDALLVAGVTGPSIEDITEFTVEEINTNVNEFIDAFNEAGDAPEPIGLEEGLQGLRVLDDDDVILEGTFEVRNGRIVSVHYNGVDSGISDESVVEMPEEMFRIVFGPGVPESFEGALEAYSKSRSSK